MELIGQTGTAVLSVLFWSAVFAYVPTAIFLIMNPLESYKVEQARAKGIFILSQENSLRREKDRRKRGVGIIYGLCLALLAAVYAYNWWQNGEPGVKPLDVVSAVSLTLFGLAVISFLPAVFFFVIKNPWYYKKEAEWFKSIFVTYGVSLLVFSLVFVSRWLKGMGLVSGVKDVFASFFILCLSAAALAYLPIMIYVFLKLLKPCGHQGPRPSVIFIVYAAAFLVFAGFFVWNFIQTRSIGLSISLSF